MKTKAHLIVLFGNFFFGAGVVAIKHITPALMQPLALNVIRIITALVLFWAMFLFKPSPINLSKKDIPLFILCALTGIVINQILYVKGASLTSPIHASLLGLSTPIVIIIIGLFLKTEKLYFTTIIGLCCGLIGALLLVLLKNYTDKESSIIGDIYIILNACSYAFYLVLTKPLMNKYKPLEVIRYVFTIGAFIIIPLGFNDFLNVNWGGFQTTHYIALAFVAIGATFISYMCIVYGIAQLGSSVVGSYIYTQPIFATISAIILFDEKLNITKIIAAIFICVGVYLVGLKKPIKLSN